MRETLRLLPKWIEQCDSLLVVGEKSGLISLLAMGATPKESRILEIRTYVRFDEGTEAVRPPHTLRVVGASTEKDGCE